MAQRQPPAAGSARPPRQNTLDLPRSGELSALRRVVAYLRSYRLETLAALLALLLVSVANLATPQLIRIAVDVGFGQRRPDVIVQVVVGLVLLAIARGSFAFCQGYLAERASQGMAYDLRQALFSQIQRLSFSYYDRVQTGQLLTRVTNDVEQVRTFAGAGVIQMAASAVMLLGSSVVLFSLNWRLALAAIGAILPIFWILARFVTRVGPLFGQVQQLLGRLNTVLQEDLAGTRVIRAFGREQHEVDRYGAANDQLLNQNVATVRALSNNFPLVFFLANLGTVVVVGYGGLQAIGGQLSIGELIAFNTYLSFLLQPMLTIGFLAAGMSRAGASSVRIFDVLDAPLDIHDAADAVTLPPITGHVAYQDVFFKYPGTAQEVLCAVSFEAQPGQTIAILGTTGAGKSTLVNLLPRFYDVTAGSVRVDGYDVRSVTLSSLRSQIGIVLQEALLFSGSVRDNIAYGRPRATLDEIQSAARAAQADQFIESLPLGYDTVVGERGVGLSGGQRQRLAIARALLVDPRLLILDDSTSALDADTELALQAALDGLMRSKHRTAFVIAQRISTVRDADVILVLDDGGIVAQGTHEQLVRESTLYNEIVGTQLRDDSGQHSESVATTRPVEGRAAQVALPARGSTGSP